MSAIKVSGTVREVPEEVEQTSTAIEDSVFRDDAVVEIVAYNSCVFPLDGAVSYSAVCDIVELDSIRIRSGSRRGKAVSYLEMFCCIRNFHAVSICCYVQALNQIRISLSATSRPDSCVELVI